MKPFGVDGVAPGRWPGQRWWSQSPAVGLPPRDTHLIVLAAHADDETLGVGGLMHAAADRLARISVLIASDGGASHPHSVTHDGGALSRMRREEAAAAVQRLAPAADLHFLGLPDGDLSAHQPALHQALDECLGPDTDTWLLAPWLDDGHPDHSAAAAAARFVGGQRARTRVFEYPIWFWHLADPEQVPPAFLTALRRFDLGPIDVRARAEALSCYTSQTEPLSDCPGDDAVLPPNFLAHFARDRDFLLAVGSTPAADPEYFDRLYANSPDPWQLGPSWYERRKRQLLLASLPRERFRRCFEPGCARGDLSDLLARRCDDLLCADGSAAAVAAAREWLPPTVRVEQRRIPEQWPSECFDLIVLSEIGYYVTDLTELAEQISATLDEDGVVVLVHWRHAAPDHPHTAETVHTTLRAETGLAPLTHVEEDDLLLDVLARDPRSVASRAGLI